MTIQPELLEKLFWGGVGASISAIFVAYSIGYERGRDAGFTKGINKGAEIGKSVWKGSDEGVRPLGPNRRSTHCAHGQLLNAYCSLCGR